ncbi:hypothetical protein I8H89_04030 [Candidatus Saccharibacteria bacterium]|nr:hypothetical protein [Candidatus Saccharibacteria bacterium]
MSKFAYDLAEEYAPKAGGAAGGAAGAAIGSMIAPGPGTAIGTTVGAAIGSKLAHYAVKRIRSRHETGAKHVAVLHAREEEKRAMDAEAVRKALRQSS